MSKDVSVHHYLSPLVGWLELRLTPRGVRSISFVDVPVNGPLAEGNPVLDGLVAQLDRYFLGEPVKFAVPPDFPPCTEFQRRVWEELRRIPYGETRSYSRVAAAIGNPKASRAVGLANGSNRLPIVIPCHRVIRSDGSLGGYASGTATKRLLLQLEGVHL